MKGLNERDLRILKKGFLDALNNAADEDEEKCIHKNKIFEETGLGGYMPTVIPSIVQELQGEGLIKECENKEEIKITQKGKQRLKRTDENNATIILQTLSVYDESGRGLSGKELQDLTGLTVSEINYAIATLEESRLVQVTGSTSIPPFTFDRVELTSRGKYQTDQIAKISTQSGRREKRPVEAGIKEYVEVGDTVRAKKISSTNYVPKYTIPFPPAGSPFGFTPEDWSLVTDSKRDSSKLYVVFGFQLISKYYDTNKLIQNAQNMFQTTINEYNKLGNSVGLEFDTLGAGYGQHLFNKIARDIISSDIAVFDVSSPNRNVMIEIGVALTWGIKVFIIRAKNTPKTPSDISGQTWAEYEDSALTFSNPKHQKELLIMVKLAARQKHRASSQL